MQQPHIKLALAVLTLTEALSCSNPSGPTPPPPAGPAIACPADVQAGVVAGTIAVQYPAPQSTGGTAPVAVSCTMPSGAEFPVGSTTVACTATDSAARVAQCAFSVNVSLIPQLKATKIVAFGDSITAGEVSDPLDAAPLYLDPQNSYPAVLGRLLTERYLAQTITVLNEGCPGERVLSGTPGCPAPGEDRLETVVLRHRPEMVILLEGVNGLSTTTEAKEISEGLRRGVRRAFSDGVKFVVVSTILPGLREGTKPPPEDAVRVLNDEIRWWAPREGAHVADAWSLFNPERRTLIGKDGLHPTREGYRRLGEFFFEHLKASFEVPPPAAPMPALLARRP